MTVGLAAIERALERYGLLLEHDKELPSITLIVAGEPISGSWWGHELGHSIYELLGKLEEHSGGLTAKLVDGKVTWVHRRLWPAFLALAEDPDPTRLEGLHTHELALLRCVQQHGPVRADAEVMPAALRESKQMPKAVRALEARSLVYSDSLHTESGAHVKVLQTWTQWRNARGVPASQLSVADAKAELERALTALCAGKARQPKLPW